MQKPKYSFYINNFGQVHIQRSNILISTKISRQPLQFDIKNLATLFLRYFQIHIYYSLQIRGFKKPSFQKLPTLHDTEFCSMLEGLMTA